MHLPLNDHNLILVLDLECIVEQCTGLVFLDLFDDFRYKGGHLHADVSSIHDLSKSLSRVYVNDCSIRLTSSNFSGLGVRTAVTLISDMLNT